ncbi:MAG: 4-hydroxythreonine-4-phosphate dehydrogenase PdxA [Longimicrobiales bacterium]
MSLPAARDAVRIAITLGDPRGIGPEVIAAALDRLTPAERAACTLIGPAGTFADAAEAPLDAVGEWAGDRGAAEAGRLAGMAITRAAALAADGAADAIVTGPIDKHALHEGGYPFPGHTEMLATLADTAIVGMLMAAESTRAGGPLRVLLMTTHLPLARVPAELTLQRIVEQTALLDRSLRTLWRIEAPRLALCALNPHASDGGLFGHEERDVMSPASESLRAQGIRVHGPFAADTVFLRALRGEFDAVLAPYHDVGMAAFKTASFGQGVNVTLGLPYIRTAPDHGTAMDIAGRRRADPTSMTEALRLALRLARLRAQLGAAPA